MNSSRQAMLPQKSTVDRLDVPAGILLIVLRVGLCARAV